MLTQDEVYQCICDELNYQAAVKDQICQDSQMECTYEPKPIEHWLLLIKDEYDDMVYNLTHGVGTVYTLDSLRLLAALCLQCVMEHGAYYRQLNGALVKMSYPVPLDTDLAWDVAVCERLYQEQLGPERSDGRDHSVSAFLVLFDCYLRKAFDAYTDNPGDEAALRIIGKLLGIVVHCMEDHGAPERFWNHVRRP